MLKTLAYYIFAIAFKWSKKITRYEMLKIPPYVYRNTSCFLRTQLYNIIVCRYVLFHRDAYVVYPEHISYVRRGGLTRQHLSGYICIPRILKPNYGFQTYRKSSSGIFSYLTDKCIILAWKHKASKLPAAFLVDRRSLSEIF